LSHKDVGEKSHKAGMVLENCEGRHLLFLSDMKSNDVLSNLQASEISVVGIITKHFQV
jgi:hypothetical protein